MTNQELEKKVLQLEKQVSDLLKWKEHKRVQQIELPLDLVSQTIIKNL